MIKKLKQIFGSKLKRTKVKYSCNSCVFEEDLPTIEPCKSCISNGKHIL